MHFETNDETSFSNFSHVKGSIIILNVASAPLLPFTPQWEPTNFFDFNSLSEGIYILPFTFRRRSESISASFGFSWSNFLCAVIIVPKEGKLVSSN